MLCIIASDSDDWQTPDDYEISAGNMRNKSAKEDEQSTTIEIDG